MHWQVVDFFYVDCWIFPKVLFLEGQLLLTKHLSFGLSLCCRCFSRIPKDSWKKKKQQRIVRVELIKRTTCPVQNDFSISMNFSMWCFQPNSWQEKHRSKMILHVSTCSKYPVTETPKMHREKLPFFSPKKVLPMPAFVWFDTPRF